MRRWSRPSSRQKRTSGNGKVIVQLSGEWKERVRTATTVKSKTERGLNVHLWSQSSQDPQEKQKSAKVIKVHVN